MDRPRHSCISDCGANKPAVETVAARTTAGGSSRTRTCSRPRPLCYSIGHKRFRGTGADHGKSGRCVAHVSDRRKLWLWNRGADELWQASDCQLHALAGPGTNRTRQTWRMRIYCEHPANDRSRDSKVGAQCRSSHEIGAQCAIAHSPAWRSGGIYRSP